MNVAFGPYHASKTLGILRGTRTIIDFVRLAFDIKHPVVSGLFVRSARSVSSTSHEITVAFSCDLAREDDGRLSVFVSRLPSYQGMHCEH